MNFDELEQSLNDVMFDRIGTDAAIYATEGSEPFNCRVIFDKSYQAIDPDGYARLTSAAEINHSANPKTGQRIDFNDKSWKLLKKLDDDGFSSTFEVTEWRS